MTRSPPVWPYALTVSLLLHAVLLLALMGDTPSLPEPAAPDSLPIEVRLIRVPSPAIQVANARPRLRPASRPPAPAESSELAVSPETESLEAAAVDETDLPSEAAARDAIAKHAEDAEVEPPLPFVAQAEAPPLHPLPPRIDMRFEVRYGIARGEQTLVWVSDGEGYTVTSVAAATGLAGIFYSGRFVQTSLGRVTAQGLVPEHFWDQRGDKRSSARFDAAGGMLTYTPAQGTPRYTRYQGDVQDTLSLFFHLALTAPPDDRMGFQVFNGRRLRHYAYEAQGEVVLDTALGPLRALHLARTGNADGRFELWLAIDRHYLPVRVLRTDDKGNEVELTVASIAP